MKKILFLGLGSALLFTMGGIGTAQADTGGGSTTHLSTQVAPSSSATVGTATGAGRCASCHRAHTSKAASLLKDSQPALCYSCHAGAGAGLDVVDGIAENGGALRGGGFQYALINGATATKWMGPLTTDGSRQLHGAAAPAGAAEAVVTSRHQIDGTTTGTMWGNGGVSPSVNPGKAGVTLECASCHDPHGNGNYRILKPIPNESDAAVAVNIPDAVGSRVYTTADYWDVADRTVPTVTGGPLTVIGTGTDPDLTTADVTDSKDGNLKLKGKGGTDGYITNIAAWCTTCHTRYLAGSGAAGATSGDAVFTYRHRSDATDKEGVSRPNCIQCHVAHGTSANMTSRSASFTAPDGLVPVPAGTASTWTDKTGAAQSLGAPVAGTSRLLRVDNRGTCVMCHNK